MRGNSICERMIGALRRELPGRLLVVNERHLRQVLTEYLQHYNTARPHRALGQLTPAQAGSQRPDPVNLAEHKIRRKQVLGGLTSEYYIAALPARVATEMQVTARIAFPSPTGSRTRPPASIWTFVRVGAVVLGMARDNLGLSPSTREA
jgi:hypothetical protein